MAEADVIVVGAGAAGSVVARRLADAGARVTVVEAGPTGPPPPALRTIDTVGALAEADRFWPGVTARTPGGASVPYRLGRGAGGGSAVNAMVVTSGDRADYDRWAADRACPGWAAADLEPWLARAAATVGITNAAPGPLAAALGRASGAAGHPRGGASLPLDATGFLAASLTARGAQRRSAADAYLLDRPRPAGSAGDPDRAGGPPGAAEPSGAGALEVLGGVGVRRLVHGGGRVTGVELDDGRRLAAGRVVLCAGAVASPRLLWASGLDAPGLGRVVDHPSYVFTVELRPPARQGADEVAPPVSALLRWDSSTGGEAGDGASGDGEAGDGEADVMALAMDHVGPGAEGRRYGAVIVALTAVASAGRIEPAGRADGSVGIDPGWLADPDDRRRLRRAVRHVGRLLGSEPMAEVAEAVWLDDQGTPLAALSGFGDAHLDAWLAEHPGPVRHPAATAPMGRAGAPGATTDPVTGALAGWRGLHLADASVLPWLPNANPMLVVLAVAERLAANLARDR